MARILGIGIATLDIVNTVDEYPMEDAEVRAVDQRMTRGGNCTNTLVVLAQLGHRCAWAGVLPAGPDAGVVADDLARHGVDMSRCRRVSGATLPNSCITLSRRTGSRTIVHYRDLPEYDFEAFSALDLSPFDWLHFEGRNVDETRRMLEWARRRCPKTPCSVEIEKPRPGIESLFPFGYVLLFSRQLARSWGFDEPYRFLEAVRRKAPGQTLVCAWGEKGACAISPDGDRYNSQAFPAPQVVDTLAAGDVFNAGVIDTLATGGSLPMALRGACELAGRKCGQEGLNHLGPA